MCWLPVYAWLRVKNKVKGTSVRIVMWCNLAHRRGNFLCAGYASTRGYASKIKLSFKGTSVRIVM